MSSPETSTPNDPGFGHDDGIAWFVSSMPSGYPEEHADGEIRAHAGIVVRRGTSLVHVETCPGPSIGEQSVWLCVVTDDRPGLLSLLSAAVAAHSLDVLGASVYTRSRPGNPDEAVDLFSVRKLGTSPGAAPDVDLVSIQRTMIALLKGDLPVEQLKRHAADTSRPTRPPETAIYFHATEPDLLLVETSDHPGLLLDITLTIFRERLSIIRSHITTIAGIAQDEFQLAEIDGASLSEERRRAIIEKVQAAVGNRR
jgi:UTP:GlnB (protein PII) uridylyltransferase